MKIFVWQNIENCTGSWHSDGGVVVVAADEARARAMANASGEGCSIAASELPEFVAELAGDVAETIFKMPNAGCC